MGSRNVILKVIKLIALIILVIAVILFGVRALIFATKLLITGIVLYIGLYAGSKLVRIIEDKYNNKNK